MPPYARVVFNLPLAHGFQYETAGLDVAPGMLVAAPFGHRRRPQVGCVVEVSPTLDGELESRPERVKRLAHVATPGYAIGEELRALAQWMAEHYVCSWGEALAAVSLAGFNDAGRAHEHWYSLAGGTLLPPKLTPKQQAVVDHFRATGNVPRTLPELEADCGVTAAVIRRLAHTGVLHVHRRPPARPDPYEQAAAPDTPPPLLPEQEQALEPLFAALEARRAETALLHGITGSGKTEIYLRALARAFDLGRQAIILVPEIALTPQTVGRFRARFGPRIGVIHSRLTLGQKLALWRRIERGEVDAVIGARSAVFAPLPRLGLIVVDEEHEGTYKQASPAPRYHARDVAIVRARGLGALVILGSATPSLESHANAARGKYRHLTLTCRPGAAALPSVELIDMGEELAGAAPNPSPLSRRLRAALAGRLARGEQSIVLLNRRGFAAFVRCSGCGTVLRCDHCDVAMTWHRARGRLVCHACEAARPWPAACPECGGADLVALGLGTQRIEETLATEFPAARTLRIDLDTTRGKDAFLAHWRAIMRGEVDIILGTQMIAKGLDLPGVTLVGVISADQTLFLPDFRAAERGFQLMTQVAGRAGRADRPGEVLIQTYVPHHYALRCALTHDTAAFFAKEMHIRRVLRFPPAQRLAALLFSGARESDVAAAAKHMGDLCRTLTHLDEFHGRLTVVGPAPAPLARLMDKWRWRLLLRAPRAKTLHCALALAREEAGRHGPPRGVQVTIDVDPMDLL